MRLYGKSQETTGKEILRNKRIFLDTNAFNGIMGISFYNRIERIKQMV